jgi:hypothetical protein
MGRSQLMAGGPSFCETPFWGPILCSSQQSAGTVATPITYGAGQTVDPTCLTSLNSFP